MSAFFAKIGHIIDLFLYKAILLALDFPLYGSRT